MKFYWIGVCLACFCGIGTSALAPIKPTDVIFRTSCAAPQRFSHPSFRDDGSHDYEKRDESKRALFQSPQTSRRKWLSGIVSASAAVGTATLTWNRPATAAAAAAAAVAPAKVKPTDAICDPTVSVWQKDGRLIYLLGTAHISTSSAELAGQLVRDSHPDAVFVELDLKRVGGVSSMARKMESQERTQMQISAGESDGATNDAGTTKATTVIVSPVARASSDPPSSSSSSSSLAVAEEKIEGVPPPSPEPTPDQQQRKPNRGGGFLQNLGAAAVGNGIRGMYKQLGSQGFNPGEEFVTAIREGQKQGAAIVLGDQDVDLTLRRLSEAFQQTDLSRLLNPDSELEQSMREMLPTATNGPGEGMSEEDASRAELTTFVETIKTKENVKRIMSLMQKEAPAIYQVMVTERDAYMEAGLNALNDFKIITAVMGLAHVDGVETNLKQDGWKAVPLRCTPKKK